MTVQAHWYGNALLKALNKEINWASDSIQVMLATSAYTPNFDTDIYKDVVNPTEATGTGYTAGGVALATKTNTYTSASSATAWAASTVYNVGDIRRPATANGYIYQCIVAGTSAAAAPTWPTTTDGTVTDGTVTWELVGKGFVSLGAANVTWTSSTITARYALIYDNTPATNKPLLGYVDFGADQSSSNGNFTITWASAGILQLIMS